jgi:membrane protease YdiL (CAAX protease family)
MSSRTRTLIQVGVVYAAFCGLGLLTRSVDPAIFAVIATGIAWPLYWARAGGRWSAIGLTTKNLVPAIAWGIVAGVLVGAVDVAIAESRDVGSVVLIDFVWGVPAWFLLMAPFQELFFRGYMQSQLSDVLGGWPGLALASVAYAVWHLFPSFGDKATTSLPATTWLGAAATLFAGLVFGYVFMRTRNIVAPWLAHGIAGVTLVVIGVMRFGSIVT